MDADREAIYPIASPVELLPLGVPQLLVHGAGDRTVPPEQSQRYFDAAKAAGDHVELLLSGGVDHFDVIDATSEVWRSTFGRIATLFL